MSKQCIVQDESGHYYCIRVELKDKFKDWVYEVSDADFEQYTLNRHISNYSFDNFQEE